MKKIMVWGAAAALLTGCAGKGDEVSTPVPVSNNYATGFEMERAGEVTLLKVHDPWQNSRNITFTYVLAGRGTDVPDSLGNLPCIRVPVERVVALSTTHLAMIEALDRSSTICGISGTELVYSPNLTDRIRNRELPDVGFEENLNYETIVSLDPGVLFMYGIESNSRIVSDRLTELGVPVVFCGEYLESHPLGKAEWIRFFGCFYGVEGAADSLFHGVDSAYNALTTIAAGVKERPRVLTGLPWKDTWYLAGGESFAARLIKDAGGDYLWSENPSGEAVPLDLESVYVRAMEADVWINPGAAASLSGLGSTDERLVRLPVVRSGEVYNNNARVGPTGANDYWESATIRPDLVLADLIEVFHPGLLTDHHFIYYRKLK